MRRIGRVERGLAVWVLVAILNRIVRVGLTLTRQYLRQGLWRWEQALQVSGRSASRGADSQGAGLLC